MTAADLTTNAERAFDNGFEIVSDEEFNAARDRELAALGLTMDELVAQAATCGFVSERARRAWFAFAPLND